MFVRIDNTPRDYAWGSTTAIAELMGREPSGSPEAELWLGAHAGSPSRILDPTQTGGAADLVAWIAADPIAALGDGTPGDAGGVPRLTFLLKVLAAAGPLSLQAHPTSAQAREGFERENAAGVPLDAPERSYKDPFHKPEMIYALSATFDALCGFRPVADTVADLDRLIAAASAGAGSTAAASGAGSRSGAVSGSGSGAGSGASATVTAVAEPTDALAAFRARLAAAAPPEEVLRGAVEWLLGSGDPGVADLVAEVVAASERLVERAGTASVGADVRPFVTVGNLARQYAGDPGIVLSLLLHRVTLRRGEALYLPAGNIHAYLDGLGVELMAASDNVLRGGLTPKHIDVPELLSVLEFTPLPVPYLVPSHPSAGVEDYRPDVEDFRMERVTVGGDASADARGVGDRAATAVGANVAGAHARGADARGANANGEAEADGAGDAAATVELAGPAIALCTAGELRMRGAASEVSLARGESVYVTPDEASVSVSGAGTVFIATDNL